jgi:hypothetical protein
VDEKSLFAEFWSNESKTTSKVLARIPEGSDYRPDPKSRTAREIAWQIVGEEKMIIEALETGAVAWAPGSPPATMKELCDAYDRQRRRSCGAFTRYQPRVGRAPWTSSASSGRHRRWHGAFYSTSCTTAARSRRICVQWDQPCRRCTARVRTSHSLAAKRRGYVDTAGNTPLPPGNVRPAAHAPSAGPFSRLSKRVPKVHGLSNAKWPGFRADCSKAAV